MSGPRLTEADKRAVLRAYGAGEKIAAIAARFGIDHSYPAHLARRRGLPRRMVRCRRPDFIEIAAATGTLREIGARFGVHLSTVHRIRKQVAAQ